MSTADEGDPSSVGSSIKGQDPIRPSWGFGTSGSE